MGNFGPGDQFEVSEILGKGFQSFFHKENKLGASLEEGKNLILIGSGKGIGKQQQQHSLLLLFFGFLSCHVNIWLLTFWVALVVFLLLF